MSYVHFTLVHVDFGVYKAEGFVYIRLLSCHTACSQLPDLEFWNKCKGYVLGGRMTDEWRN